MSTYPSNIPVFPTLTDEVDVVAANDVNSGRNEIIALCQYIGTNPQGSKADLVTRLQVCLGTDGAIQRGSAYPTNPLDGQLFFKRDEPSLYVYSTLTGTWTAPVTLSNRAFEFNVTYTELTPTTNGVMRTFYDSQFKKVAGMNTLTIYFKASDASQTGAFRLDLVGGLTSSYQIQAASLAWTFYSISLSGLTNGSIYNVIGMFYGTSGGITSISNMVGILS